ncbi:MAG: efflux RND transporter permease subunit [Pseudomonadota bacterium]
MNLSDVCIQRPVFSIVLSLILTAVGVVALFNLPLRQLPEFDEANITIMTRLPGASAQQIEGQVSATIENAVASLTGITKLTSTSMVGTSIVKVKFGDDITPQDAVNQVSSKAIAAVASLPAGTQIPVVRLSGGSDSPMLFLGLQDTGRDARQLTTLAIQVLVPQLKTIDGVASIMLIGERKYAMIVALDAARLASENLTIDDVVAALDSHNTSIPSGQLGIDNKLTSVVAHTSLHDIASFENIVVARRDGYAIRVSDVGRVSIGEETATNAITVDGRQGVALGILRRPHSNPLEIAKAIRAQLPELQASLPVGTELDVIFDKTIYIGAAIDEVINTILIAIGLVILTMVLFLGSWRSSMIVIVTIPVSLIASLAFILPLGFSLNTFTLLAIVLAVGLVVDDAIVDVENVERHIDEGHSPLDAAVIGSREVTLAVVATTLTLAAIYLPVGFMSGKVGHMFREFGFTLAIAVMVSGFVSRTLSPMMCSRLLTAPGAQPLAQAIKSKLNGLADGYRRVLEEVVHHRLLVATLAIAIATCAIGLASKLPTTLAPKEDQGYVLVALSASPGTTLDDMLEHSKSVDEIMSRVPEKLHSLVLIGQRTVNSGMAILMLKPWSERTRTAAEIQEELNIQLSQIKGLHAGAFSPPPFGGETGMPIKLAVKTSGTYEDLYAYMDKLKQMATEAGAVANASSDLSYAAPKIDIQVDREAAQRVGVDPAAISSTLSLMLSGAPATPFTWKNERYPVSVRLDRHGEATGLKAIDRITLRTNTGDMLPLSSLITWERHVGALSLSRADQNRAANLSAMPGPDLSDTQAIEKLKNLVRQTLPSGMTFEIDGAAGQAETARTGTLAVFGFALLIVFLLLAAQFESFLDPFIILVAAPFAVFGGLLGLVAADGSLNAYTAIALVTLVGMIAKHGILITEFANQRRDAGADRIEGLLSAARDRLRPILMTTTAAIMGALPLLLAAGPGANSRQEIGIVIVCGMALGTLVSLFLVPCAYSFVAPKKRETLVELPQ